MPSSEKQENKAPAGFLFLDPSFIFFHIQGIQLKPILHLGKNVVLKRRRKVTEASLKDASSHSAAVGSANLASTNDHNSIIL
ncbi:hypothetical protein K2173_018015 [Erythroxylum novogranatense]|uniref:Uncharacterized protein n=1 Tax=Erythroxylum novogranatense TaxID=1862640 RepID=A0AAV8TWV0_9ROSI|nr:hypothetical protein K2173_018015 [Erythroxylum novogranatense]